MPKITFISDLKVQQFDGNGPLYATGETYDLERSYAEKYKRRGFAVDYVAPPKPAPVVRKVETMVPAADEVVTIDAKAKTSPNGRP